MDFDFDDFVTPAPRSAGSGAMSAGSDTTDDLIRQLNNPPPSTATPSALPPSMYRPSTAPSYSPPANQFATSRVAPGAGSAGGGAAVPMGGGGGTGGKSGWWSGIKSLFGSSTAAPTASSSSAYAPAPRVDTATIMRKRKRKLIREIRLMLEADAIARAKNEELTGISRDETEAYQMRCTEASSLEEIEDEHDLVEEEHNERVGMDTSRSTFVATIGQIEYYNDALKPLGPNVQLKGLEEAVRGTLGDYEADIRVLRETVAGLGLPSWCYTGVKLGMMGAFIAATNRKIQTMVNNGDMDESIAYHPRVRDAVREVTIQQLAEAARHAKQGTGTGTGGNHNFGVGPGPPVFVNNKPRMPDPDSLPRPGAQSQFMSEPAMTPMQPWHPAPQYQHDPYAYEPPNAHSSSQPIVSVPMQQQRPNVSESARDARADRSAYMAQQNAFREAQMHPSHQQHPPRPDLAPPAPIFGAPANFPLQYPSYASDTGGYSTFDRGSAFYQTGSEQQEDVEQEQEHGGSSYHDFDDDYDMTAATVASSRKRSIYEVDDNEDVVLLPEEVVAEEEVVAVPPAASDSRSVASAATGPKRQRRRKNTVAAALVDDDLAMSML